MTREQRRAADLAAAKAERWPPVGEVAHEAHAQPRPLKPAPGGWAAYRQSIKHGNRHDQEESAA